MIYVFRRPGSEGATELAEALDGRRVRFYEGGVFKRLQEGGRRYPTTNQDIVVCWGERVDLNQIQEANRPRILNNVPLINKMEDALKMKAANVPTVEVSRTRPAPTVVVDPAIALWEEAREDARVFAGLDFSRGIPQRDGVRDLAELVRRLHVALGTPLPPATVVGEWLARSYRHVGGNDLLAPPVVPEFWVRKEDIAQEFRIHSFLGKSIKAGVKVAREGVAAPHAWIRSLEGGWRVRYDGFESTRRQREVAHAAVRALGLDFGAVDLGQKRDGNLIVLEVNRAPGLGDGTVNSYAAAIRKWRDGVLDREVDR